jgi:hypothetical protein
VIVHGHVFPLVPGRRIVGLPFGAMRSSRRGSGSDLAGSRPYRPGDDVRRIDWRASARLTSAGSSEEFVVREHLTEEAARVVIVVDRSPRMAVFADGLPWLSKPAAIVTVGSMIVASALRARCLVGYLDDADGACSDEPEPSRSPFWREPRGQEAAWLITERDLPHDGFRAPEDTVGRLLEELPLLDRSLARGTFVFLLSDFLAMPAEETLRRTIARGFDVVPVVLQDPTWEQSFPPVAGAVLPVLDPAQGRASLVCLNRSEVEQRRCENEARLASILARFAYLGLDPVLVSSAEPGEALDAFLGWSEARRQGMRLAR